MAANNNAQRQTNNSAGQNKQMNYIFIQPNVRQFLAEIIPIVFVGIPLIFLIELIPHQPHADYILIPQTVIAIGIILMVFVHYLILNSLSWKIDNEKICRQRGVLARQTDYIELYRVVDYRESQTFLQRLLGVKTVIIISTDKSDAAMLIKGVPAKSDIVGFTRKLVEQIKKDKRVYEITNR